MHSFVNSCLTNFWPILCRASIVVDIRPFAVSVFCDKGKPNALESFLRPFLEELIYLEENRLDLKGIKLSVILQAFICDAPARSFVKCIRGHGGKIL